MPATEKEKIAESMKNDPDGWADLHIELISLVLLLKAQLHAANERLKQSANTKKLH